MECEAGGVCILDEKHLDNRIRCRCPLGRGGFFCEKPVEIRFPRFRGTSYLALPTLRDAHRSMQINIHFKPEHYDGVVLYSGEQQTLEGDFISLTLNQGFAEFRFDCGMGDGVIRSDMPVVLNSWNTLTIYRDGWMAWMQLNQGQQISGQSKGLFSRITFRLETFLGGSPNITQIAKRVHSSNGFIGCVRGLQINDRTYDFRSDNRGDTIDGVDIEMCTSDVCNKISCLNNGQCVALSPDKGICLCPLETDFMIPSFNGSSYLQFPGLGRTFLSFIEVKIVLKPISPNGLFLYNGNRMDGSGDFVLLNLIHGFVEFRFDLGSGPAVIRSRHPIAMNEWHTIVISRTGRQGILQVNDETPVTAHSYGAFSQMSLSLNLFVGGVPDFKDIQRNAFATNLFSGCIQSVIVNNRPLLLLEEALSGVNVVDCPHHCSGQPCLKGGRCEPQLDAYLCHCPLRSFGKNCEQGIDDLDVNPMFYGNSYFEFTNEEIMKRVIGSKISVELRVRAFSPEGVIFWTGVRESTGFSDWFSIGLSEGFVKLGFDLGSGEVETVYNVSRIDDGQWHDIHVLRHQRQASIKVDDNIPYKATSPGSQIQLNTKSGLFLGGLEDTPIQTFNKYKRGFIGCVSHIILATDYHIKPMSEAIRGINIRSCV
ncbi:unnamed protein product [Medioppia subpectinata]|uniref:Pikachurin n=2 Tax=Medioppia subpectinata TaxID=1979941 RepID=A0A7R9KQD8_9ACAR|nr:unnamed protein product [Medioppia subpectinata]CAG2107760.1 unnamed protein product [Medioppia subpectinata]